MSVRVMSWVWESSASTGIDRLVLLAIADYAHDDGSEAYPSIRTLARKTKVGDRTVQRAIRELIALGELSMQQNAGRRGSNMYRVHMDIPTPVNLTPPSSVRGVNQTGRGVNESKNPRQPDTRTINEPLGTVRAQRPKDVCRKHPNGTDDDCGGCARAASRARAWDFEQQEIARAERTAAVAARVSCPTCDTDGFLLDHDGYPSGRCSHQLLEAAS